MEKIPLASLTQGEHFILKTARVDDLETSIQGEIRMVILQSDVLQFRKQLETLISKYAL